MKPLGLRKRAVEEGSKSSRGLWIYLIRLEEAVVKVTRRVYVGFFWDASVK